MYYTIRFSCDILMPYYAITNPNNRTPILDLSTPSITFYRLTWHLLRLLASAIMVLPSLEAIRRSENVPDANFNA